MAWTFASAGQSKTTGVPPEKILGSDWLIASEIITIGKTSSDQSTSVIDFLPYGKDFFITVTNSTEFLATAPIDIDVCDSRGGTFSDYATTGLVLATADASYQIKHLDNSAKGIQAPYIKLRLDKTGTMSATTTDTVTVQVWCPPNNGVIY